MANQDDLQQKLRMGIDAARRGDKPAAQVLLREVVASDPDNELAWMWLASAVDDLSERRQHLERVLRINPNNPRAREALDRLQPGGTDRPTTSVARPRARQRAESATAGDGPSTVTIIVGAVVVLAVITALIFALISSQQPTDPTRQDIVNALSPSFTPSLNPNSFTSTPTPNILIVTANVELPPTFTATFTPPPSATPFPSSTPIPLTFFTMIFTGMEPGAATSDLYQAVGDGSGINLLGADIRDIAFDPSGQKVAFVRELSVIDVPPPPPPTVDETAASEGEIALEGEAVEAAPEAQTIVVSELFVAPVDDLGAARQITDFGSTISKPTWAPNGIQLAFVSNFDGDEDIWTITDDGENIRKITENQAIDRDPAWSPLGDQILYVSDEASPGLTKLYTMTPDGDNPTLVIDLAGNTYQPRWSHTGSHIVFVNDAGGDGDVYIAEPDGESSLLLTSDDGDAEDLNPVFTPDGNWVGFASNRGGETFQLYVLDTAGSVLVQLTDTELDKQELDFRPELILRLREGGSS